MPVTLTPADPTQARTLENLLELYMHDMSEFFPLTLGPDGRYGYSKLPLYWSDPERHFAFLIHADRELAGFALIARGSPASTQRDVLDLNEFFVLRSHRRCRVGQHAATQLWDRLRGDWIVRVADRNADALHFWRTTVGAYTRNTATERAHDGVSQAFRVFEFHS